MKRLILVLVVLLLLPTFVFAVAGIEDPDVSVTLISQDPDPVEPGQILTVKFKVENDGGETKRDAIVTLLPQHPFSIYQGETSTNIGKLRAGSTGSDAEIVEFKLKIADDAVEGEIELELVVRIGDFGKTYKEDDFLIDIQTHDAILDITSIKFDSNQVTPGEASKVTITVKNLADSLLKDIKFSLDFEDSTIPLAPYQSSSQRRIANLETDRQVPLTFNIIADPAATPGLYKVPMNITYNDEKGNKYQIKDVLAVPVGEIPKIRTYVKRSTVLRAKKAGVVTLGIANAGTTDVKFMEIQVLPSEDFELFSTSSYFYVGDVDSDDTESEELDIYVNRKVDVLKIPFELKYYDANNNPYSVRRELSLNLYSSRELKKFGLVEGGSSGTLFVLFVLVVVFGVLYRRHKKDPTKHVWVGKLVAKIPFIHGKKKKK